MLCGISNGFPLLFPGTGQVAHALLTLSPLIYMKASFHLYPFDLHVLSTPPAFVLSQDQTLNKILIVAFCSFLTCTRHLRGYHNKL